MKILFIIYSLSGGGAERAMVNLSNYLSKNHDVYIITLSNEESFYKLNQDVKHIKLNLASNSKNIFSSIYNTTLRILTIYKNIHLINPDIIVSFTTPINILSIIAAKISNKKIVVSEHIHYNFYKSRAIILLRKLLYPLANRIIILTKNDEKNYRFVKNKISVLPNPIVTDESIKIEKTDLVLAVGRLEEQKGFDSLIEIFSDIKTDWTLYIAGEGSQHEYLNSIIEKKKIKNIKLIGAKRDIFNYYAKASIFIMTSKEEGLPTVLIEAMFYGCAVISYDCPTGPAEIIKDNINGLLIENQNKTEMKKRLTQLINDKSLREKLSKNAMEVKKIYGLDTIGSKWSKLLEKTANE